MEGKTEERRNRINKAFEIVFWLLVFVSIYLVIHSYMNVKKESSMCFDQPLVYGVREISESNHAQLTCECSFILPWLPEIMVDSNKTTLIYKNSTNKDYSNFTNITPYG